MELLFLEELLMIVDIKDKDIVDVLLIIGKEFSYFIW